MPHVNDYREFDDEVLAYAADECKQRAAVLIAQSVDSNPNFEGDETTLLLDKAFKLQELRAKLLGAMADRWECAKTRKRAEARW